MKTAMPSHRIAILSARRCGSAALHRLLAPAVAGPAVGGQPFHWDLPWGAVSREFHQGSTERSRQLLDECLASGAMFHHRYDAESWDFNQMLLDALAQAGYGLVVIERTLDVDHLFSIFVAQHHDCRDAATVTRLRHALQTGHEVPSVPADDVRQGVFRQWQTQQWFDRALAHCAAPRQVCAFEKLFLRGVAGLAVVDELFAFAGRAPRNALVDDASLLRFLWMGQHYTAGLAAYSPALRTLRADIATELSRIRQQPAPAAVGIAHA
jgi:hypothetical protein